MSAMTAPKKRGPGAGRKKGLKAPRKIIMAFKGYEEFDEWLDRLSTHVRMPRSLVIEHALIAFAKSNGFDEIAPER